MKTKFKPNIARPPRTKGRGNEDSTGVSKDEEQSNVARPPKTRTGVSTEEQQLEERPNGKNTSLESRVISHPPPPPFPKALMWLKINY